MRNKPLKRFWLVQALLPLSLFGNVREAYSQSSLLATWEYGSGSPLVVVLHGGPGVPHGYLLPEWRRLESISSLLFYDQRGCGESAQHPGPYGWTEHVADLDLLIREHSEGKPVVLAGSSWGAILALLQGLEGKEPIRGIILSGYPGWWGSDSYYPDNPTPALLARLDSLNRGLPLDSWREPDTLSSGNGIGGYEADSIIVSRIEPSTNPSTFREVVSAGLTMPPFKALAGLDVPILIISGDRGGGVPDSSEALAKIAPLITRVILRNAAHDPWAADPDAFFGAVEAFLQELGLSQAKGGNGEGS